MTKPQSDAPIQYSACVHGVPECEACRRLHSSSVLPPGDALGIKELQTRIAALEQELAGINEALHLGPSSMAPDRSAALRELFREVDADFNRAEAAEATLTDLRSTITALVEEGYVQHLSDCLSLVWCPEHAQLERTNQPCSCGLQDSLARLGVEK